MAAWLRRVLDARIVRVLNHLRRSQSLCRQGAREQRRAARLAMRLSRITDRGSLIIDY